MKSVILQMENGDSFRVQESEAIPVKKLQKKGFSLISSLGDEYILRKKLSNVVILVDYHSLKDEYRVMVSIPEDQPSEVEALKYSVREAVKGLESKAKEIARRLFDEAGIPKEVRVPLPSIDLNLCYFQAQGTDFNEVYRGLRKASKVLGVEI